MKKTIGIYNRYWSSLGGGEKHVGSFAEVLSKRPDYDVCLIGIEPVDKTKLESRYRLDLSRCRTATWADDYAEQSWLSQGFDLFVNSTFFSPLPSMAKRSAYFCFFPQELMEGVPVHKTSLADLFRPRTRLPRLPSENASLLLGAGFYGVEEGVRCWAKGLSNFWISRSAWNRKHIVVPIHGGGRARIHRVLVDRRNVAWRLEEDFLIIEHARSPIDGVGFHVFVDALPFVPSKQGESGDTRELAVCLRLPKDHGRLGPPGLPGVDHWVDSYDSIIANSAYTAGWVRRRWGRSSDVLPPGIETGVFTPPPAGQRREKVILSVGRFFVGGHNKKHDVMIRAFRQMVDSGRLPPGWRLVIAGSRHREKPEHIAYYEELERLVDGYPIQLCPDIPFDSLLGLYRTSSIYWHAAGFGENPEASPELFEHFGITTCEAMACGMIPVVIDAAGQREIVNDGQNGYRYSSIAGLIDKTLQCLGACGAGDDAEMRLRCSKSIDKYSLGAFSTKVNKLSLL